MMGYLLNYVKVMKEASKTRVKLFIALAQQVKFRVKVSGNSFLAVTVLLYRFFHNQLLFCWPFLTFCFVLSPNEKITGAYYACSLCILLPRFMFNFLLFFYACIF